MGGVARGAFGSGPENIQICSHSRVGSGTLDQVAEQKNKILRVIVIYAHQINGRVKLG